LIKTGNRECFVKTVRALPQGLSAAVSVKALRPKNGASWASVDVGHRTVLLTIWNGSKPNIQRSQTLLKGGHQLIDLLSKNAFAGGLLRQKCAAALTIQTAKSNRRLQFNGVNLIMDGLKMSLELSFREQRDLKICPPCL
jgi:hypothetical protein